LFSYNSVVYSSTRANEFIQVLSPQNFSSLDLSNVAPSHGLETCSGFDVLLVAQLQEKANAGELRRMKSKDCFNTYSSSIFSQYGNVLVVLNMTGDKFITFDPVFPDAPNDFESTTGDPDESETNTAKCSGLGAWAANSSSPVSHTTSSMKNSFQGGEWTYSWGSPSQNYAVLFCLSEYLDDNEEVCTMHVSVPLLLTTLFLTFLKTIFMLSLLVIIKATPLLSTGDAVASFLDRPDKWTNRASLLSKSIVKKTESATRGWQLPPQRYKTKNLRWQKVTSTLRRASFLLW
jgi:hypothetical protein